MLRESCDRYLFLNTSILLLNIENWQLEDLPADDLMQLSRRFWSDIACI